MPPVDAVAESLRREDLLTQVASGKSLAEVGLSAPTYSRWKRAYDKSGVKGLEPKFSKCGRRPLAQMDDWEKDTAKRMYVQTESVTTALRMMASLPECSAETADAILRGEKGKRRSKHSIPRNLRQTTAGISPAAMAYHKSPKDVRTNFFVNPRSMTYLDPIGKERPILVGDLSERDDMSNNFLCWVDWPWGGDACSDRFGVRVARGQTLTQIDVASVFFQSFSFLVRLRDSYRADDIWQWVGNSYEDIFVPAIGERWERGIWRANKLRGIPIDPGHTSNETRIGGITALGRRIIESQSPTTKIIENRFKFLQLVCRTISGQIGAKRGEMERENKLWTECRAGRRDPREHFLSHTEATAQIEAKMQYVNHEPVEGCVYHGVPAEIYQRGLAERGDLLKPLAPEQTYLFSRDLRKSHVVKGHALVRYTTREGRRLPWYFHHPELYKLEGEEVAVYMDEQCAGAGATLVAIRPGADRTPLRCELVDGVPQFALGLDMLGGRGAQAAVDAIDRRKAFMNAVVTEYRALGVPSRRIARVSKVQDGAGGSAAVRQTERRGPHTESLAGSIPARSTAPRLGDPDRIRKLEEQFRESNPGIAVST